MENLFFWYFILLSLFLSSYLSYNHTTITKKIPFSPLFGKLKIGGNYLSEYDLISSPNPCGEIDDITIYSHNKTKCGPVVSFNIKNCHPFDIAKLLDTSNIAIRAGHHCSQLLMQGLNINFTNRISLYAYNTKDDIDYFIMKLTKIKSILIK